MSANPKGSDPGTCGFCGFGGGYLTEQGDETSRIMSSIVKNEDGTYTRHPNAWKRDDQFITWCGNCIGGLEHRYARYSDHNLHAKLTVYKFWKELDDCHFSLWGMREGEEKEISAKYHDDPAIHLDKLARRDEIPIMENETFRRAGFDLTSRGWRP